MLKNKNQIILSADWHFGHKNMHKLCGRPEFFEDIIKRNLVVKTNELTKDGFDVTLVCLGDVCWSKDSRGWVKEMLGEINCAEKILIKGNHDKLTTNQFMQMGFTSVVRVLQVRSGNNPVYMTHHPQVPCGPNTYFIHGHLHQNLPEKPLHGAAGHDAILISQELLDCRAITLEEVLSIGATPKWNGGKFVSAYE